MKPSFPLITLFLLVLVCAIMIGLRMLNQM